MARHMWRVDKAPGHPRRNQNACLKVLRLSMGQHFCDDHTESDANWLKRVEPQFRFSIWNRVESGTRRNRRA